ncbi:MAG TPA: hypothetical protein VKS22_05065 [Candidatus Binataceae bacterium]|nr:hypothetical protein [Candidatus Binataceae bacterium]
MSTPFDEVVTQIKQRGFHDHRLEDHSDIIGTLLLKDLRESCVPFEADFASGKITSWLNVRTPGARNRKIDVLVGEPDSAGNPDLGKLRVCVENKSVITAHRNLYARFDDLNEALQVLHRAKAEAVLIATVIFGVAERVLNVPDRIKSRYRGNEAKFDKQILPRLSSGDQKLWKDFHWAVSVNRPKDPAKTVAKFRQLPTRAPGHTHIVGYDYVLLIPAFIDNVNTPFIPNPNDPRSLHIDVEQEYRSMLEAVCKAYSARWHL